MGMVSIIGCPWYKYDTERDCVMRGSRPLVKSRIYAGGQEYYHMRFSGDDGTYRHRIAAWKVKYAVEQGVSPLLLKDIDVVMVGNNLMTRKELIRNNREHFTRQFGKKSKDEQLSILQNNIREQQRLCDAIMTGNYSNVIEDLEGYRIRLGAFIKRRFGIVNANEIVEDTLDYMLSYISDKHGVVTNYWKIMTVIVIKTIEGIRKTKRLYEDKLYQII